MSANHRHRQPSRLTDQYETGYFRMPLVRGGWKVPCRIALHAADGCLPVVWTATVDGVETSAHDPVHAGVDRIWHYADRIDAFEYLELLALKDRCRVNDHGHPCLHPREKIDALKVRPVLPRRTPA